MFHIFPKEFEIDIQNRKWNYFSHFQADDQKTTFTKIFSFLAWFQNWFSKQETELSKQEKELFISLPGLWSKNFFYKMFHIFPKEFKIDIQKRKWNYLNRKWNYFSHFQAFDQKTTFTKIFSFPPMSSKLIFKTKTELSKQEIELFIPLPFLGVCDEIPINLNLVRFFPTVPIAHENSGPLKKSTKFFRF